MYYQCEVLPLMIDANKRYISISRKCEVHPAIEGWTKVTEEQTVRVGLEDRQVDVLIGYDNVDEDDITVVESNDPILSAPVGKVLDWGNIVDGKPSVEDYVQSEAERVAAKKIDIQGAVQAALDSQAQSMGYDNIFTAVTYAD